MAKLGDKVTEYEIIPDSIPVPQKMPAMPIPEKLPDLVPA
jgi:hypothetical protein